MTLSHEDSIEVAILNSLDNEALAHAHLKGEARETANAQGVYDNSTCYAENYDIDTDEFKSALLKTYGWLIKV